MKRLFLCSVFAGLFYGLLYSQSTSAQTAQSNRSIYDLTLKELMEVSVITAASGFEQSVDRVFASNTVITREEWQAFGAATLNEALNMVPGVHVAKSPFIPVINPSVRGLAGDSGEQIKLLIDGRPLERAIDGSWPFGFYLPLSSFKRIEVVRGPGSAIYGADAFGGVINLVSNDRQSTVNNVSVGAGRFGSQNLAMAYHVGDDDNQLMFSVDYMKFDDDPGRLVYRDLQSNFDALFGTNASLAPMAASDRFEVLTINSKWQWHDWSLSYFGWRNFDGGLGIGLTQAADNRGGFRNQVDIITLDWALGKRFGWQDVKLTYNFFNHKNRPEYYLFPAGAVLPIGSDGNMDFTNPVGMVAFTDGMIGAPVSNGYFRSLKLTQVMDYGEHRLRWQVGYQQDSMETSERKNFGPGILDGTEGSVDGQLTEVGGTEFVYMLPVQRHFYFISVMNEWQLDEDWLLNIGARYDRYSQFGSTTNPRAGLIYQATPKVKLKLFAGSAFRIPSFQELYVRNNPVTKGNSTLQPEDVNTMESGFVTEYLVNDNFYLTAGIFKYHAKDLIQFEFDDIQQINVAQNTGEQKGKGFELSMRYKPWQNMTLLFNYSHFSGQFNGQDNVVGYPRNLYSSAFNWQLSEGWSWSVDGRWIKDRERAVTDNRQAMADDALFNTTLSTKTLLPGLDVSFSVKNLFDRKARDYGSVNTPDDYPLAGRTWAIQLRYAL